MSSDLGTPYAGERIDESATRSPACPACGRHSQPEAAFCAFCGTPLVHQRVPGPPVFAAVATAIEGRTAYDVLREVGPLFESLGAVFEGVSRHPATLVALFPPREDAAVVAVRAAIGATERCPEARVGIDASEVTERSDQDAIWQDLIDRSADLGSVAVPGTIVASEAIPALTEGAATIEPVDGVAGAAWLRGVREIGPTSEPAVGPAHEPEPETATPFVGRERELDELAARFEQVRTQGRAACLAIVGEPGVGEPGVGTTRLAEEFLDSLTDARTFIVRCDPELDGGAWPLAALVESLAGLDPNDDPETTRARIERLVAETSEPARATERIAHLLAIDGGEALGDETRWAIRTLIDAAILGPSVMLVDDVDRVAFGFAAFLGDIARALRSSPLLIVCTAAAEPVGVPDLIALTSTDEAATRSIVAARLGAVDPSTRDALDTAFGRSPLLLEQGIAMLLETSGLVREDERWVAAADLGPRGSSMAKDVISERIRALPEDVRTTAGVAALVGPAVASGSMPGGLEPEAVAPLAAAGLLVATDGGALRWVHPLVREAAAAGVPPAAAAELHRELARAELLDAGPRRWRHAASAGSRLAEAVRLAGDAAAEDDRVEALELLTWAAGRAAASGDPAGASFLERRAAGLLPGDDPRRADLLFAAALHQAETGRSAETEAAIAEATAATVGVPGDPVDHHVRILRASLRAAADRTTLDAARAIADEAYERFTELDDPWGCSRAAALRAQVHAARGHAAATFDDLLEAAELARAADRPGDAAAALRGAGRALLDGPMPVEEALARSDGLRSLALGHPLAEHDLAGAHAVLLARRGRSEDARVVITSTVAAVEELGADADLAVALHRSGVIWWLAGEFHAAEPPIQRALAAAGQARDDRLRARIAASWANLVLATEDRVDEAMALADLAETWATDPTALVGWRTARARALVRKGDVETADRLGRQAVSLAEQTDSTDLRANALLHLAEVLRLSGRPAEAGPFQRRALRILDRKGATAQAAAIFRSLVPEGTPEDPGPDDPEALAAELSADDDLERPAADVQEPAGGATLIEAAGASDDPAPPIEEPVEPSPAGGPPVDERSAGGPETVGSPPQPIAATFAASSEGEPKKKGLFRR